MRLQRRLYRIYTVFFNNFWFCFKILFFQNNVSPDRSLQVTLRSSCFMSFRSSLKSHPFWLTLLCSTLYTIGSIKLWNGRRLHNLTLKCCNSLAFDWIIQIHLFFFCIQRIIGKINASTFAWELANFRSVLKPLVFTF